MTTQNDTICSLMSAVLLRSVRPSLFSGTSLSSIPRINPMKYLKRHIREKEKEEDEDKKTRGMHVFYHREENLVLDELDEFSESTSTSTSKSNDQGDTSIRSLWNNKVNGRFLLILEWYFPNYYEKHFESNQDTKTLPFMIYQPLILILNIEDTKTHSYQKQISSLIHQCIKNKWICIEMKIKTISSLNEYKMKQRQSQMSFHLRSNIIR